MGTPAVGKKVSSFKVATTAQAKLTSKDLLGKPYVLYFYPKDDTPGCTHEAIEFSEMEEDFGALKTVVVGVSMDDCLSHGAFRDKHGLAVQLLADTDGEVCRRYGVLHDKEAEGRKRTCIVRSTFIIDRKGVLRHALYGVNARGHAQDVLGLLRGGGKCR